MRQKDLAMIGESIMKHPKQWSTLTGVSVEEIEEIVANDKEKYRTTDEFKEMYDFDCVLIGGLYEAYMRGAGMEVTQESFDKFLESVVFEWWEENILPSRERIMISRYGENLYYPYDEISLDDHWK